MDRKIFDAIKKTAAIPSMPQVVVRFLEILQDPAFDYNDLAKLLSADPGTAAELLRLTNSALFGLRNKVTNLKQGLAILGPRRVRSFVLGRYLVSTLGGQKAGDVDISYFWRRSLCCGILASRFAAKAMPKECDDMFMAGLLADVGIPILAEAFPEKYQRIAQEFTARGKPITAAAEWEAVGVSHAEVSAAVLEEWGLPKAMYEAVALHQVALSPVAANQLGAGIIAAADIVARLHCEVPAEFEIVEGCTQACAFLGLELQNLADMLNGLEGHVQELAAALKIEVISSDVYRLLAKTIRDCLEGASAPQA